MLKIFDCFTFFNELDILELRLNELDAVVDRFVIAEAPVTYRGRPKPLHFRENSDRFAGFLPKITHLAIEDVPLGGNDEPDHWRREHHQRRALARGLADAAADDLVMISDVDEIPRPTAVEFAARQTTRWPTVFTFEMAHYYYYLNLEFREGGNTWAMSRMTRRRHVRDLHGARMARRSVPLRAVPRELLKRPRPLIRELSAAISPWGKPMRWTVVPDAGWHFSYMNGPDSIREKLLAYSHVMPDGFADLDAVTERVRSALAGSREARSEFRWVSLDGTFPAYLMANRTRFGHMIAPDPAAG